MHHRGVRVPRPERRRSTSVVPTSGASARTAPRATASSATKFDLPFTLLADEGHPVADLYGAWGEKTNYGKTYMGLIRSTFLIDPDGRIAKVWPKVKAQGHAEAVLAALDELQAAPAS